MSHEADGGPVYKSFIISLSVYLGMDRQGGGNDSNGKQRCRAEDGNPGSGRKRYPVPVEDYIIGMAAMQIPADYEKETIKLR